MDDDDVKDTTTTQRSPEQRELGANPPSLDAESERQAAERRAADHRDRPRLTPEQSVLASVGWVFGLLRGNRSTPSGRTAGWRSRTTCVSSGPG
jgi:hypothetical protein